MPSAAFSRITKSNAAGFAIALVLAAFLAAQGWAGSASRFGIDFYQFWGVPVAKSVSGTRLTPYVDVPGYSGALNALSEASASAKLRGANRYRRTLEPMGTPFLYASFALFPLDYESAHGLFAILQYLAAGVAVYVLARLRGAPRWPAAWIALAVELTFMPFVQDLRVGNVNSVQLLFMVALLLVAVRRVYSGNAFVDGLFIGSLAIFVVFKPNTPWIALAFAIHYGVTQGVRRLLVGAGLAALLGALALATGAWYFGGAHAWVEWLAFARGMDGSGLPLTLDQGNLALTMLLAQRSMSTYGPVGYGLIVAGLLLVALLLAASQGGRRSDLVLRALRAAFSDPWFAASIGVVFTLATSPLVWPHYLMFALIPIFWLVRTDGKVDSPAAGAVFCYVALSLPLFALLGAAGWYWLLQAALVLSWVALVPGVFVHASRQAGALQAAAA